jgi:hypothetical protein
VELGDDHALGAVDDERPLIGHDRDFPEIDLLLLDVPNALRPFGGVPGHEPDRDLERSRVAHAPLQALLHVVFGLFERVAHELQRGGVVEVLDRKDRVEDRLQSDVLTLLRGHARLQEAFEGLALDLDQSGNLEDRGDLRVSLANSRRVLAERDVAHRSLVLRERSVSGAPVPPRARVGARPTT